MRGAEALGLLAFVLLGCSATPETAQREAADSEPAASAPAVVEADPEVAAQASVRETEPVRPANDSDRPAPNYVGETYTCLFPKAGKVMIDTREPGSTITYRGETHAATGGSYFYTANDRPEIMVMFGPRMAYWEFGTEGDRASDCTRRANTPEGR